MTPAPAPPSRVLLYLINKPRDLATLARLAVALEARGHAVRFAPPWDLWAAHRFLPHLAVLPQVEDPTLKAAAWAARAKGCHVVNLLAEGTISRYVEASWGGAFSPRKPDHLTIAWGRAAKEILVRYGRDPARIAVCGNPRFDKYARPLLSKDDFCRRHGWDPTRPVVLYATSLVPPEGIDPMDFKTLAGYGATFPRLMRLRTTAAEVFFDAVEAFPDAQFVVKLHPYDRPQMYHRLVAERGVGNVVVYEGTGIEIADALNVCDVMLHWNSTTSAEAWFLGKPTLLLHFDPGLEYYLTDFVDGSDFVASAEDLRERLRHYLGGGAIAPHLLEARRRYVEDWFDGVDGRSLERVVAVLERHLAENAIRPRRTFTLREFWFHAQVLYRRLAGLSPPDRILPWKPRQSLYATPHEIAEAVSRARAAAAASAPGATKKAI